MNAFQLASHGMQSIVDAPEWIVFLLKITGILLAAWLAHLALMRTNPRWRVLLWRIAAVGLIALPTVAWLLPTMKIYVQPRAEEAAIISATSNMFPTRAENGNRIEYGAIRDSRGNIVETGRNEIVASPIGDTARGEGNAAMAQPQNVPQENILILARGLAIWSAATTKTRLLALWLGGIAFLCLRISIGHYQIIRMVRRAKTPPPWIIDGCVRVAKTIGCRTPVEVLQSDEVASPVICGLHRPRLLLPGWMCNYSYCNDLPGILAHELTHVRSHDIVWNAGLQLVSVVLWFHPLVWQMRKAHLAACELVCDAISARFVGDVSDYCRTLARVATEVYTSMPAAGIAMARTSSIGRRLNALKRKVFDLPLRRRNVLGFGAVALLTVLLVGTLQFALAEPPAGKNSSPRPLGEGQGVRAAGTAAKPKTQVEKEEKTLKNAKTTPNIGSSNIHVVDDAGKIITGVKPKNVKPIPEQLRAIIGNGSFHVDRSGDIVQAYIGEKATDDLLANLRALPILRFLHVEVSKHVTDAGLVSIGKLSSLESLTLHELGVTDDGLKHIGELTNLRELSLPGNRITSAGLAWLADLKNLTKLDISNNQVTDAGLVHIARLTQLRELNLSYFPHETRGPMRITDKGLAELRGLKELRSLNLERTKVTGAGLKSLVNFPKLESLMLSDSLITDEGMDHVAGCPNLQHLSLSYTWMGDDGLAKLVALKELRRLSLSSMYVTDAGIATLKSLPLEHLELRAIQLTDKALAHIAEIKTLTRLDLDGSGRPGVYNNGKLFSHKGLAKLKELPQLRYLYLNNFELGPSAIDVLCEMGQLKGLVINFSKITEDQISRLRQSLPNTYVSVSTGGSLKKLSDDLTAAKNKEREKTTSNQTNPAKNADIATQSKTLKLSVIDEAGKPVPNARVKVSAVCESDAKAFRPPEVHSDNEGIAVLTMPEKKTSSVVVFVRADGYLTSVLRWEEGRLENRVPAHFSVTLEAGATVGGIVRDENQKPIEGAEVVFHGQQNLPDGHTFRQIDDKLKTDADGKWVSRRFPKNIARFMGPEITLKHPDYASPKSFDLSESQLGAIRTQNAVWVMRKGIAVEGKVTDSAGRPIAKATVGQFNDLGRVDPLRAKTDEQGRYRLPPSEPGERTIAAAAAGYTPDSRRVAISAENRTADFRLGKGEMIRLRVLDQNGKPLANAYVSPNSSNKYFNAITLEYSDERNPKRFMTDSEGRWNRLWIPGETLTLSIGKPGYAHTEVKIAPRDQEHIVTLEAGGWGVSGRVVDRETKAPVTKFRVVEGYAYGDKANDMAWHESRPVENNDGRYRADWDTSGDSRRVVRIEADGYFASEPRRLKTAERQATFDVELIKGQEIAGVVRSADGKPASNAQVALCTATRGIYLQNGRPLQGQPNLIVRTGADGRFALPPQRERFALIVLDDQGFAQVDDPQSVKEITLQPWARVEGTIQVGEKPGVKESVVISFDEMSPPPTAPPLQSQLAKMLGVESAAPPRMHFDYRAQTDDNGRFVFERVRPGKAKISRQIKLSQDGSMSSWTSANTKSIELIPGKTLTVQLSGADASVIRQRRLNETKLREQRIEASKQDAAAGQARVEAALKVLNASPPATEDAKIEAALEILRNYPFGHDNKPWAMAIRELITIGKPTVPKLIAELDGAKRRATLSTLGFVLRGIGDLRSVPALIRTIPRVYPAGGSDCALRIDGDPELTKFMLEHDNLPREYPRHDRTTFMFGRSIREIMPALEKITGQSHGWLELNFADQPGVGTQQDRIKRAAFLKLAERWADWWAKNWSKYVSAESDAQLDLTQKALADCAESIAKMPHRKPPFDIPTGSNLAVGSGFANHTIISFDEPQPGGYWRSFRDLDSGRLPIPPQELVKTSINGEPSKELIAWAEREGVDLIVVKTKLPGSDKREYAFAPLGMKVWRIDNGFFDNLQDELNAQGKIGRPWTGPIAQIDEKTGKYDAAMTASYLFITKEGICGALQLQSPLATEPAPGTPAPRTGGWHYKFISDSREQ
jgi:beta-lactamase regulating signal transducer with metallopeptidase domain/protocatechuate 3,4-dioxygenase beta subunit/Leucine-rich repeat (LRR) protein